MEVAALADLLHETAEQHGLFEAVTPPHNWWDWYAAYLNARRARPVARGCFRHRRPIHGRGQARRPDRVIADGYPSPAPGGSPMSYSISGHSDNGLAPASRSWKHLHIDRRSESYCRVTFDHLPINTITATTVAELAELVCLIEQDPDLNVVVFDSANPGFYLAQ